MMGLRKQWQVLAGKSIRSRLQYDNLQCANGVLAAYGVGESVPDYRAFYEEMGRSYNIEDVQDVNKLLRQVEKHYEAVIAEYELEMSVSLLAFNMLRLNRWLKEEYYEGVMRKAKRPFVISLRVEDYILLYKNDVDLDESMKLYSFGLSAERCIELKDVPLSWVAKTFIDTKV